MEYHTHTICIKDILITKEERIYWQDLEGRKDERFKVPIEFNRKEDKMPSFAASPIESSE